MCVCVVRPLTCTAVCVIVKQAVGFGAASVGTVAKVTLVQAERSGVRILGRVGNPKRPDRLFCRLSFSGGTPQYSVEINSGWNCTSSPLYAYMAYRGNFTAINPKYQNDSTINSLSDCAQNYGSERQISNYHVTKNC